MSFHDDPDYLLDGIEGATLKQASPATFDGPIDPIWSVKKEGDLTVLVRPEDPFGELRDAVERHKEDEVQIECDLTQQAAEILELQQLLEDPICASKTAGLLDAQPADVSSLVAPAKERISDLAGRIEEHLKEQKELAHVVDEKAEETVTLIDRFRGREAGKTAMPRQRSVGNLEKAWQEYSESVESFVQEIIKDITDGTITDDESLRETIQEFADSSVIYTHDAEAIMHYSTNRDAAEDSMGSDASGYTVEQKAYFAVEQDVYDDLDTALNETFDTGDIDEAISVAQERRDNPQEVDESEAAESESDEKVVSTAPDEKKEPENEPESDESDMSDEQKAQYAGFSDVDSYKRSQARKQAARKAENPHGLPQNKRDYCEDFMLDKMPTKGMSIMTPHGEGKVTDVGDRAVEVELLSGESRVYEPNRLRLLKPKAASLDILVGLFDGDRPTRAQESAMEHHGITLAHYPVPGEE